MGEIKKMSAKDVIEEISKSSRDYSKTLEAGLKLDAEEYLKMEEEGEDVMVLTAGISEAEQFFKFDDSTDILDAEVQGLYEEVVQAAVRLKRGKECSNIGTGHYAPGGYKDRGILGVFIQLDKKHKSLERLLWGPEQKKPTQNIDNLSLGQLKKVFDHSADSVNYHAFLVELIVEYVIEKFGINLLDDMGDRGELA